MNRILTLIALCLFLRPDGGALRAWGSKGHELQARAVIRVLPPEMPAFLREAEEEMAFLITEPDRWRTGEQPALTETFAPNHSLKWELAPHPFPANRHRYLAELVKSGKLDSPRSSVRDFGTAPYAMQEWAEMLTAAFRRWREMPDGSAADQKRKRQHERNILFMAGILGHWVTDVSQPMHSSVHIHGWDASAPNPHGYSGKDLHRRYETDYVERAIELSDVARLTDKEPRMTGDWLREAEAYIGRSNAKVEQIYIWDKETPFGGGKEPEAARSFTAERLAEGARMLRDIWYTAWKRSAAPLRAGD